MPFKNETLYLAQALESILNQSEENFELIMIDDHSIDDSFQIAQNFSIRDSRIKLFKNIGHGIINALQFAQEKAIGNFITRQDADDLMPQDKLKSLKSLLKENGKGFIATGKVKYFSDTLLLDGFKKYEEWVNRLCDENSFYKNRFKECVIVSSNWMLHKSDFDFMSGYSDSIYPEDYHFTFKVFKFKLKIISTSAITHLWRDHSQRASRNLDQYKDQKFFPLKVIFFHDDYKNKNICLWGAGKNGKKLARVLIQKKMKFHWITNNEKKIGKIIYDQLINPIDSLQSIEDPYIMISVTQRGAMKNIKDYLLQFKLEHYFEF